jgi:hypothetical protein
MSTRAQVDQIVQVGVELTSGTRVAATRRLPGVTIDVRPSIVRQQFRAKGYNVNTADVIHRMSAEGTWEGPLDFNQIIYPLATLIGEANNTPAQIGATDGWTWEFTPLSTGSDPYPKTLSVETGDSEAVQLAKYVRMISASFDFGADALNMSGNLLGYFPEDSQTLTSLTDEHQLITKSGTVTAGTFTITYAGQTTSALAYNATAVTILAALEALSNLAPGDVVLYGGPISTTPLRIVFQGTLKGTNVAAVTVDSSSLTGGGTYVPTTDIAGGAAITSVAQRPVSRMQADVYVDDTFGAIGTTKVTSAYNAGFEVGAKWAAFFAMNTDYPSFQDLVHIGADVSGRFSTAHNAQSRALYNAIATNPTKFIRIEVIGANIGTNADEMIRIDFAAHFGAPEPQELDGAVFGYNYNWGVIHDPDFGGAWKATIVNRLTTL